MATPTREEQIAEAAARGGRGEAPTEGQGVNADLPAETTATPVEAAETERMPQGRDVETAPVVPPDRRRKDPRDDIVARFRRDRGKSEAESDAAEIRAFARQGLPPEMAEETPPLNEAALEEPPAGETTTEPAAEPQQRRRLKVRGQEVDLTEDELIAAAQRGLAGDSYFDESRRVADEAKDKLDRVNTLLRQTEQGVRQPAAEHPGGETTETPGTEQGEHPAEDPYVTAVKQIAFESPEQAAQTLKNLLANEVKKAASQETGNHLVQTRKNDELARNQRALKDLEAKHPDIVKDRRAIAAIKDDIAQMQRADLLGLGIAEEQAPALTDQTNLANWHLHYRANGMSVRPMAELLEKAISNYREWKGETPTPATRRQEPRVVLSPERTQRRASIPQQPSRAVVPRPDAPVQPRNREEDRSAVVAQMKQARMARRGVISGS